VRCNVERRSRSGGANVNEITSPSVDDLERLSGMAHLNGVPVRLERIAAAAPVVGASVGRTGP
jgi:hypothetical protein